VNPTVTQIGESIGTPAYMSPEQHVGDEVDARSDVYSLGVVVCPLLAGVLPFRGSAAELLRQHFVAEVPSLSVNAGIPPRVDAVVRRALSKDPAERFQSVLSFSAALSAEAMEFSESMRRALAVFADRFNELATLGAYMAVPGLAATVIGVLAWRVPIIWVWLLVLSMVVATPLAMASIATIFDDIRNRPFVTIGWRRTAEAVTGRGGSAVALFWAWITSTLSLYIKCLRTSKGSGVRNMLLFVDAYRHRGVRTSPERIERMVQLLPTGAFATMAIAQMTATVLLPAAAMLAAYGLTRLPFLPSTGGTVVIGIAGSLAFTAALILQVFIALVDVMLYDLAYDMTAT
jgi:eukaryotic-like serine/threonine-protein kinase